MLTGMVEGHAPRHSPLEDGVQSGWSSPQLGYNIDESLLIQTHRLRLHLALTICRDDGRATFSHDF